MKAHNLIQFLLFLVIIFYLYKPIYAAPISIFTDPVSNKEVWQMTNGPQFEGPDYYSNVLISPNGKYFVYDDSNSATGMSIMNTDGTNKRSLGNITIQNPTFGSWSPDSAYYYSASGLYKFKVDTNQTERIPNASQAGNFYHSLISPDGWILSGVSNASDTTNIGIMKFIKIDGTNYRAFNAPVQNGTGFDISHGWVGNEYAWYLDNSVNDQYRNIERVMNINTGQYVGTLNAVDPDNSTSWEGIFDHPILSEEGYMAGGRDGLIAGNGSYWGMANTDFFSGFNPTTRQLRRIADSTYPTFFNVRTTQTQISPNGKWILSYNVNSNCSVMALFPTDKSTSPFWLATYGPSTRCDDYASYYGAYGSFSPDSTKVIFQSLYELPNRTTLKPSGKPDVYVAVVQKPDIPTNLSVENGQLTWKPAFNHREIKEYEIYQSSTQNGNYQKIDTLSSLHTYAYSPSIISSSQTTVFVDSTSGFANQGVIEMFGLSSQRPTELIFYTGKTDTSFTGCTRGYLGSHAAEHYNDAFVWQYTGNHGYDLSPTPAWYKVRSIEWSGNASELSTAIQYNGQYSTPQPTQNPKPGDANGDRLVNVDDFIIWVQNYNTVLTGANYGDFNNSGNINLLDFGVLYMNWGL